MESEHGHDSLPIEQAREFDRICTEFERALKNGENPSIPEFLPDGSPFNNRLQEHLAVLDIEHRIAGREAVRIERYLDQFFGSPNEPKVVQRLLEAEIAARRGINEDISPDELTERFPDLHARLVPLLQAETPEVADRRFPIRLNCPHCRNPIVIVEPRNSDEADCPSCGSSFHVDADRTVSWSQDQLPELGRFQLVEAVGRGAFGTVYRAKDLDLDRTVAVKVPRSGTFESVEDEDRFVREARNSAQLSHPGIVPVFEVGQHDRCRFIVSEFVDGVTLSELLTARSFGERESAELVMHLAEALEHAHRNGVYHRDLKPSNIMLERLTPAGDSESKEKSSSRSESRGATDSGSGSSIRRSSLEYRPRIMDFGLARRDTGEVTVTVEGQILGTPAYMSPEQARGEGHRADARSDTYALGVILFELLTGERPFRGSARMLLHQVIHDDAPSPRKLTATTSRDLETICLKCLEKDPQRRFASAGDCAAELLRFLDGQPILARPVSRSEKLWRWCRRNPSKSVLGAITAFTALIAIVLVTRFWLVAEEARDRTEVILADSWIRSIGASRGPLLQTEEDSLWDVVRADDKLKSLFMERALQTDDGASRLIRRRDFVAQAVVGASPVRRRRLLEQLEAQLKSTDSQPLTRIACALLAVELQETREGPVTAIITALFDDLQSVKDDAVRGDVVRTLALLAETCPNVKELASDTAIRIEHASSANELSRLYPLVETVVQRASEASGKDIANAVSGRNRRFLESAATPNDFTNAIDSLLGGLTLMDPLALTELTPVAIQRIQYSLAIETDERSLSVFAQFVARVMERSGTEQLQSISELICNQIIQRLESHDVESKVGLTHRLAELGPQLGEPQCRSLFVKILARLEDRRLDFYSNREIEALQTLLTRLSARISPTDATDIAEVLLRRLSAQGMPAPDRDLVAVSLLTIIPRLSREEAARLAGTAIETVRQAMRRGTYELPRLAEIIVAFSHRESDRDASRRLITATAQHVIEAFGASRPTEDYIPYPIIEMFVVLADHMGPEQRQALAAQLGTALQRRIESRKSAKSARYGAQALTALQPFLTPVTRQAISREIVSQIEEAIVSGIPDSDEESLQIAGNALTKLQKDPDIGLQQPTAERLAQLIVDRLEVSDFREEPTGEDRGSTEIRLTETLGQLMEYIDAVPASELSSRALRRILQLTQQTTYWDVSRSLKDLIPYIREETFQELGPSLLVAIDGCSAQRRKGLILALLKHAEIVERDSVDVARHAIDLSARAYGMGALRATESRDDLGGASRVIHYASRTLASRDDWAQLVKVLMQRQKTRELVAQLKRPTAVGPIQKAIREELMRRNNHSSATPDFWGWAESEQIEQLGREFASIPERGAPMVASLIPEQNSRAPEQTAAEFQMNQQAVALVSTAYQNLLVRQAVIEHLQADQTISSELRQRALKVVERFKGPSVEELNKTAWEIVRKSKSSPEDYARGLRAIEAAVQSAPESGMLLNTLGVAQYRVGNYRAAVSTLLRAEPLNQPQFGGVSPFDMVFLAMALHKSGDTDQGKRRLQELRDVVSGAPNLAHDPELQSFLHEAESLIDPGSPSGEETESDRTR